MTLTDIPPDPNKGPAQQMRDAEKKGLPIPGVAHIADPDDFVLQKLDLLIQWMTKYNPAQRISFNKVHKELKVMKGELRLK